MSNNDNFQEALLRLTSPHFNTLHKEIEALLLRTSTLESQVAALEEQLNTLSSQLSSPEETKTRVNAILVSAIYDSARNEEEQFAKAIAPIMGPAIRHQIREAKEDIIEALFPLIGQIIGKALSEAIRELTRNIDARLRKGLDLRTRYRRFTARLQGLSEAEAMLREVMPFSIKHVFLIHYQTGLLLSHLSISEEKQTDLYPISGMLTAIRDFVRDSFEAKGELEEIAHGDQRILLASGKDAYLAVVLEGLEPSGYGILMDRIANEVNVQHELSLRKFDGNPEQLPDLELPLKPFLQPAEQNLQANEAVPMSRSQKRMVWASAILIPVIFGLLAFACLFFIRLWPYAFPDTQF